MIPDVTPNGVFYLPPTGWLTSFYNPPFSLKRDYFINANELTDKQLNKIGLTITPGFYSHGKLHETVNFDKIISLWEER